MLIASCFSRALTVFYSPAWNGQSSKFWQRISLPMLLALADYWSRGVWIISQVPLTPGLSQVINWIAHVLTTQFPDSACSNYTICWPGRYSRFTQYNHRVVPLICMAAVVQILLTTSKNHKSVCLWSSTHHGIIKMVSSIVAHCLEIVGRCST